MRSTAPVGLIAIALTSACFEYSAEYCEAEWNAVGPEDEPPMTKSRMVAQVLAAESKAVDILFVIDNSRSMMDEQEQLGIWSSELFNVLSSSGELPDLHIGVTSSGVAISGLEGCEGGTGGSFLLGSAALQGGHFIRDIAGPDGRIRNYTGTLEETFAKMALVGDAGCGFEQPFKAARLALSSPTATTGVTLAGSNGTKAPPFLRDDALLLVVFVTDEDDCSASNSLLFSDPYANACSELGAITSYRCFEHGVLCYDGKGSRALGERTHCRSNESSEYIESVSAFATSLKAVKRDPGQVIVAGIYGKPNNVTAIRDERVTYFTTPRLANVCNTGGVEGTGATPAVRMNALMAEFGGRASHSSICEPELAWAMRDAGLVTRSVATRSHCLRGRMIDYDAQAPGVQPSCTVQAASNAGTPEETREEIVPCVGGDTGRCFTVEADPIECADSETQLAFRVQDSPDGGRETMTVRCDVHDDGFAASASDVDPRSTEY